MLLRDVLQLGTLSWSALCSLQFAIHYVVQQLDTIILSM